MSDNPHAAALRAFYASSPWTDDQVASLNAFQAAGRVHPFTGDTPEGGGERPVLIATNAGWVEYDGGPIYQTWAHSWMTDWSWKALDYKTRLDLKE